MFVSTADRDWTQSAPVAAAGSHSGPGGDNEGDTVRG